MPNVIVSPCGTSLLTNETEESLRKLLIKNANHQEKELSIEEKKIIDNHYIERRKKIENASIEEARKFSAELNGILTYYNGNLVQSDHHYIITTDTYVGQLTSQLVEIWLNNNNLQVIPKTIKDLSTKNIESFRIAMSEIVRWCAEELEPQYANSSWKIIFNLTGGFKSVNGFLQTLAMFYADESIYIFESGGQLLRIPRLPVQLDPEGEIGENLDLFRRLAILKQELRIQDCLNISETLLEQIDNRVSLSEWGKLIWQKCWRQYYQQQLLPPLSKSLQYSDRFYQDSRNLPPDRLSIINERLDQLSRCLNSNGSDNPRSLDFKALKGKPFKGKYSPEPTHECDAWSDRDAKRIYGHFDDKIFTIDFLGEHL